MSLPGGKNWVWRHHNASLMSHLSTFSLKHAFTVEPHKTINKISKKYPTPHITNLMFILLYSIGLYVWRVDCRLIICLLCHRYFHFMYTILQYSIVQSADLPTLARGCTNLCALQNLLNTLFKKVDFSLHSYVSFMRKSKVFSFKKGNA